MNPLDILKLSLDGMGERKFRFALNLVGILIGFASGMCAAVIIFAITDNIAIAVPVAGASGLPMGISFEKKFRGQDDLIKPGVKKAMFIIIAMGVIVLSAFYMMAKFN